MTARPSITQALYNAGLESHHFSIKEKRKPWNAKERPGQMFTQVTPIFIEEKSLQALYEILEAANPAQEVECFYGDYKKNLRPLVKVWW